MDGKKPTLLFVDDDPAARAALVVALEDVYDLVEAASGEETLRVLQERKDIDLVLLDSLLPPGIDGLEVMSRMKGLRCEVPVIMVTGKGSEQLVVEAFRSGVKNYVIKLFRVTELREIVGKALGADEAETTPLHEAMTFIEENFCHPISSRTVAEASGISLSYLEHIFHRETGSSITKYMNALRIQKAKTLLTNENALIKEVASSVGFEDPDYFCRVFKRSAGCTPKEYRKKFR